MCAVLQISRSTYYYECKQKPEEQELVKSIQEIFRLSRNNSGTRKIKVELADYVNWFNNHRIHSSLNYLTPREFEENTLKKVV